MFESRILTLVKNTELPNQCKQASHFKIEKQMSIHVFVNIKSCVLRMTNTIHLCALRNFCGCFAMVLPLCQEVRPLSFLYPVPMQSRFYRHLSTFMQTLLFWLSSNVPNNGHHMILCVVKGGCVHLGWVLILLGKINMNHSIRVQLPLWWWRMHSFRQPLHRFSVSLLISSKHFKAQEHPWWLSENGCLRYYGFNLVFCPVSWKLWTWKRVLWFMSLC